MENASRALIMAGSILIALMIIGALLLMFNNLSSYQDTNIQTEREAQVLEFNNQYETYIRKDVRGSELYSLLSKVIDYNKRKSDKGTEDEGQDVQFKPITIKIEFKNSENRRSLAFDNQNKIFIKNTYELDGTQNNIEELINNTIPNIEKKYGKSGLTNLTTGISNLFDKTEENDKKQAIELWNKNSKVGVNSYSDISQYKEDIYTYYEYIQFKRMHFNCNYDNVEYDKTGRVIKMCFESNGKIE